MLRAPWMARNCAPFMGLSTDRNAISYEGPSCINTRVTFKVTVWVDNQIKLSLLSLFKMSVSVTTKIPLYKGTTIPKAKWQEIDRDSIRLGRQLSLQLELSLRVLNNTCAAPRTRKITPNRALKGALHSDGTVMRWCRAQDFKITHRQVESPRLLLDSAGKDLKSCLLHRRSLWVKRDKYGMWDSIARPTRRPALASLSWRSIRTFVRDCENNADSRASVFVTKSTEFETKKGTMTCPSQVELSPNESRKPPSSGVGPFPVFSACLPMLWKLQFWNGCRIQQCKSRLFQRQINCVCVRATTRVYDEHQ